MLREQGPDLVWREVAEAQRSGLDVESAAPGYERVFGARMDAIVAHVAYAAQDDALREPPGTPVVAGAQLAEHGQQGIADERVNLVDEQHQGPRVRFGPQRVSASRRAPAGPERARIAGQNSSRNPSRSVDRAREASSSRMACIASSRSSRAAWADSTLAYTQRNSPRSPPFRRSRSASREEVLPVCRGACSTKYPLLPDELQDLGEIEAFERRDAVVVRGDDGTFGVEEAHGGQV